MMRRLRNILIFIFLYLFIDLLMTQLFLFNFYYDKLEKQFASDIENRIFYFGSGSQANGTWTPGGPPNTQ